MSDRPSVSVVVVSRHRPARLTLCLAGLSRLYYTNYEIVVVADRSGLAAVRAAGLEDEVKTVAFDRANISEARNLGIAEAAGEIVAFIDDDAVPEPSWIDHLVRAFTLPEVAIAGGYVRGRNGISYQWRARSVDCTGAAIPLDLCEDRTVLLAPAEGRAIKTEGTNMAVRRSILAGLGGFDPAFRFYMDETDLNLRLAASGHTTAIVPLAEVHHAYAESGSRTRMRAPADLFEVGASTAVFLRKHCPDHLRAEALGRLRAGRRTALLSYMVDGRIEPRDVTRLMARLEEGIADGSARQMSTMSAIPHARQGFVPFATRATGEEEVIAGRFMFRRRHRARAAEAAARGKTVSLYLFSRTALAHRLRFVAPGIWEQRGGLWGRSDRSQAAFCWWRFTNRVAKERQRVEKQRKRPSFANVTSANNAH